MKESFIILTTMAGNLLSTVLLPTLSTLSDIQENFPDIDFGLPPLDDVKI
jgi:hypothetical protein